MSENKKGGSRNFYGEYSLEQWINFMLTKEIILPDYQRAFVWEKEDVEDLINSLKDGLFVPPVTIGNYGGKANYILDGQQRLSAILIAYIGLFPNREKFKFKDKKYVSAANENDDFVDEEDTLPIEWQFNHFTTEGHDKESILNKIDRSKYDSVDYGLDKDFWKDTYIGFSLIIPISDKKPEQQKLYSSVFRNINIKGKSLSQLESRKSLYFLRDDFDKLFSPQFANSIAINNAPIDFVRYLSLLSQYKRSNEDPGRIAQNYKTKMEKYYESYILAEVNNEGNSLFSLLLNSKIQARYEKLEECLQAENFPKKFNSIISADIYLFGLIYYTIAKGRTISLTKQNICEIEEKIQELKDDNKHTKSPSALKYLRCRIQTSIDIYRPKKNKYET